MLLRTKRGWLWWGATSVVLFVYVLAGFIASHITIANLELTPGQVLDLDLSRLNDDTFGFVLVFKATGCEQRPELGQWRPDDRQPGTLRFAQPGSDVRMRASALTSAPIEFQAMPLSAYCSDSNMRRMTSDVSLEPGVWRWGQGQVDNVPSLPLHPGFNRVRLEVTTVEPPLVGETVEVVVNAPLSFKFAATNLRFLHPALYLWPLFALSQTIWLAWLALRSRRQQ